MIKVGDRVKFLNDVGGGVVTGFIGKSMVYVENEDGFEIPCPVLNLINVDDPDLKAGGQNEERRTEIVPAVQEKEPTGQILEGKDAADFYFCFVPDDAKNPLAGNIDLFLVNDSNFTLLFHYAHFINGRYKSVLYGSVPSNSEKELESIGLNDLSSLPEYCFQLICFREDENEWHPAVSKKFKINPVKFYKEKSYQSNPFFEENALLFQITGDLLHAEIDKLTEDDFRRVVKAKEPEKIVVNSPKPVDPDIIEVDLHIHELVDNTSGLSNKELLDIQLEKVEREMRLALQSRSKQIVFIHGVGQGVLKQEIAKLLGKRFPKYNFHDASFKEYGYGATMVVLRRK